jgi:uncharacterized membrane protein
MTYIPLNATVECLDGPYGKTTKLIADPTTKQVRFLVVEETKSQENHLVSTDLIRTTTNELISLNCHSDEVEGMEPYIETYFVPGEESEAEDEGILFLPYAIPAEPITGDVESMPRDQLDVQRGAEVEATDGHVGKVDEFLIEPINGNITHLVLREGRLWSKRDLTLPVTAIDRAEGGKVYLKLNQETVGALPAIPVKRSFGFQDAKVELIVLAFENTKGAVEALEFLQDLAKNTDIGKVRNAAVLIKDEQGEVTVTETQDIDRKHGAIFGAIAGGLVGLVGGPVGVVVGAAAGAATGGAAARRIDMGFSDKYLNKVKDYLKPGTSALIAMVEHEWRETVASELSQFGGQLFRQALTDDIIDQYLPDEVEGDQS